MDNMQRILVVVQGTQDCLTVFDYAAGLAETFGAKLYVLDIIHNPFAYTGWNLAIPSMAKEYESLLASIRARMKVMVGEKQSKGFPIESLVREGDPPSQIVKVVEEEKIDMLVIPAHEETRLEHFLLGKMTERIIRRMPCSILLVKLELEDLCSPDT
jgi:nucleotide-binding universal stress UspA family protein